MKFLAILCVCLLFLVEKGNCFIADLDSVQSDFNNEKGLLSKLAEKLDSWDQFFSSQSDLAELNENLKNLRESIRTCDGNKSVDNFLQFQEKINRLDSKLDSILSKNTESNSNGNQFASLEKKLSRLQYSLDRSLLRNGGGNGISPEINQLGYGIEDMIMELASKIDALYEKSTAEERMDFADLSDVKHLGRTCRMLTVPYKKLMSSVEYLRKVIGSSDEMISHGGKTGELRNSVMSDIRDRLEGILDEIQLLGKRNEKNINENERLLRRIDKKLNSELEDDDEDDEKLKKSIKKYVVEQRILLEKNLKKMLKNKDGSTDADTDSDSDDDDDDDNRKKKSRKNDSDDDDDDDDSDDDDDDDDDDGKKKKKKKSKKSNKEDDDSDESDEDVECDDSDENGSKSCEKVTKKAYLRGKKNYNYEDFNSNDDEFVKKKKIVRKSIPEVQVDDTKPDEDRPSLKYQQIIHDSLPPEAPQSQKKIPDVTP